VVTVGYPLVKFPDDLHAKQREPLDHEEGFCFRDPGSPQLAQGVISRSCYDLDHAASGKG
jgi:hypothetical protein